ncbi:hypothetical protein [Selenihalanaerobacter shriftii]|uniref:Uncharacterized protein n=1 Tax=Selenihalanaerobacter shriftii TaxID=142842 RepID=A0A1T4JUX7_9FIRM|nr:hypothetical protein [Selenihalanaerobacter shriftii]SJZ33943.1 hypothetical protein SAMN02745118_00431 [Selenihalanaerobacter shriftii]
MRIELAINDLANVQNQDTTVDMILRDNMTIGSLKRVLDIPPEYTERIMVNGVKRSEYYSLNSGDQVIFESGIDYKVEDVSEEHVDNNDDTLKSEIE